MDSDSIKKRRMDNESAKFDESWLRMKTVIDQKIEQHQKKKSTNFKYYIGSLKH